MHVRGWDTEVGCRQIGSTAPHVSGFSKQGEGTTKRETYKKGKGRGRDEEGQ